jgi:autotransporter-associated beta strand protein
MSYSAEGSAFTTTVPGILALTLSGSGITNNSGVMQNLVADANSSGGGSITFTNSATAGVLTTFNVRSPVVTGHAGGALTFEDTSSAGEAVIITDGPVVTNGTTAVTSFHQSATAGNATLIANASHAHTDYVGGVIDFFDTSTAGNSNITIQAPSASHQFGGFLQFFNTATAGDALITVEGAQSGPGGGGQVYFRDSSTAGNATLIIESSVGSGIGASVDFIGGGTANGGNARLQVFGNGFAGAAKTWGSIEGDGKVYISSPGLAVGSNNFSTTFSGLLSDITAGPFSKVGDGTLTLAGANTYAGGTTINAGTLLVTNASGSATGSGPVTVAGGTLGGSGIISGAVTIGTGSGTGASLTPAFGSTKQVTLTLQSSLTLQSDATYTYGFKARSSQSRSDLVVANGVTITGAKIKLKGKTQGTLTPGLVLTVISNTSANPIGGTFSNLADGAIVTINGNNLQASYIGGDGNDLTLTVVP